jgi:nitroreductase
MDVFEAIYGRRSVRAYRKNDVSEEQLNKILDAARHAPSAGNIQPWEFVVVRDSNRKMALARAALNQFFIAEAPVVVVVCANQARSSRGYGSRGASLYCLQDTAAAIQNMLLAVHALGLGACWVGAFNESKAAEVLNTPEGVRPIAIIPIGHPGEKPHPTSRRSLKEIVHYEKF